MKVHEKTAKKRRCSTEYMLNMYVYHMKEASSFNQLAAFNYYQQIVITSIANKIQKLVIYNVLNVMAIGGIVDLFLEIQSGPVPLPNDKAVKEKKRKLRETLDRLLLVFVSMKSYINLDINLLKALPSSSL